MTVLVTGATGHIGVNLIRSLVGQGRRVRAMLVQDGDRLRGLDVEHVHGDVRHPKAVREAVDGADVVYHLAGRISLVPGDDYALHETNVLGVRNVVNACIDAKVRRLVHFSSIHALSAYPREEVIDERRPLVDAHDRRPPRYDASKASGEREVQDGVRRGLDAVVVNPTGVIGPFDHGPSALGRGLLTMHRGQLRATVAGGFNFVDARDVVAGAMTAEKRGQSGHRYVLGGEWISMMDLGRLVESVTGAPAPRVALPMSVAHRLSRVAERAAAITGRSTSFTSGGMHALENHRYVNSDKAADELAYRPRPLREAVADTFAWFRSAGML